MHGRNNVCKTVSNLFTNPGCCANVNGLFENSKTVDNSSFNALSVINRNLGDILVKSVKQVSTLNFFN
jgi:hypothetical protein